MTFRGHLDDFFSLNERLVSRWSVMDRLFCFFYIEKVQRSQHLFQRLVMHKKDLQTAILKDKCLIQEFASYFSDDASSRPPKNFLR